MKRTDVAAVDRADKAGLSSFTTVEPSEELRLLGCQVLCKVVKKLCGDLDAASILHPYYHEIIMYLAHALRTHLLISRFTRAR